MIESTDLTQLLTELCRIVELLLVHRRCFFVLEARDRYVQARVDRAGVLALESVSNSFLVGRGETRRLTADDEVRLLRLGWQIPGRDPNWLRVLDESWRWPAPAAAELLVRTLWDVHHAVIDDLRLTIGRSPRGALIRPPR